MSRRFSHAHWMATALAHALLADDDHAQAALLDRLCACLNAAATPALRVLRWLGSHAPFGDATRCQP
jgi:hypothetical protein